MDIQKDVKFEISYPTIEIRDPITDHFVLFDYGTLVLMPDYPESNYFRWGQRDETRSLSSIFDWQKIETRTGRLPLKDEAFPALELNFKNLPHIKVTLLNGKSMKNDVKRLLNRVESLNYLKDLLKYTIADKSQHTVSDIEWLDEFFSGLTPGY